MSKEEKQSFYDQQVEKNLMLMVTTPRKHGGLTTCQWINPRMAATMAQLSEDHSQNKREELSVMQRTRPAVDEEIAAYKAYCEKHGKPPAYIDYTEYANNVAAEKDGQISDMEAEIAKLRAQLAQQEAAPEAKPATKRGRPKKRETYEEGDAE